MKLTDYWPFERYTTGMDVHPFTGTEPVCFDARLSAKAWLDPYFNGTPNYEQVRDVTRGKTYSIRRVAGMGDVADFAFLDDKGHEQLLGSFFFERP